MGSVNINGFDIQQLRNHLRSMSDDELMKFGKAAKSLCDPRTNYWRPPREVFAIQLKEAREEWKRRHLKEAK
ncbi:MAG: hypothetical protein WBR26_16270 [Candidatus Acidiferrum sp.]